MTEVLLDLHSEISASFLMFISCRSVAGAKEVKEKNSDATTVIN